MQFPPLSFTVLDTETTGFVPRTHRIIEFASMRIENGELVDTYETLIQIPGEIPPHIQSLTHIYPDDLEGKPTMDEVRDEILEHIGEDTIIVGQNVGFDIRMLKGEDIDLTNRPWIDTSMIASLVYPELASYSLGHMSQVLGLDHAPMHRALGDVRATTELLCRSWERLVELTPELREPLETIIERAPEGYQVFFGALPEATASAPPAWLASPGAMQIQDEEVDDGIIIEPVEPGTVQLFETPVDTSFLQHVLDGAKKDGKTTWIAVKNAHGTFQQVALPSHARVIHSPGTLLDPTRVGELAGQSQFTADEATLAVKLAWYEPATRSALPLHGDERAVWNSKVACTDQSEAYAAQFADLPSLVVIDHQQLLRILDNPEHPGYETLTEQTHVIVDDASMLEDTATKAYGGYCSLNDLRAKAEGNQVLSGFLDLLQIWIERSRDGHDTHHITHGNLTSMEAKGLTRQLGEILEEDHLDPGEPAYYQFRDLAEILDPDRLEGRITWIETRQDGSQFLQAAPERIGTILKEELYDRVSTTLLVPPESKDALEEVIPKGTSISVIKPEQDHAAPFGIAWDGERKTDAILSDPPEGKTVILMSSRGRIEDAFVRFTDAIEKEGGTLICQSFSGGTGRMQATFLAAEKPVIWLLTPWAFEGIQLDAGAIDTLVIDRMPFDHPNHTVLGRRSAHYSNAFGQYSLPRMQHRLYRLLRTFSRYAAEGSEALLLDERLDGKEYGRKTWQYLKRLVGKREEANDDKKEDSNNSKDSKEKGLDQANMNDTSVPSDDFKQSGVGQMQMF